MDRPRLVELDSITLRGMASSIFRGVISSGREPGGRHVPLILAKGGNRDRRPSFIQPF